MGLLSPLVFPLVWKFRSPIISPRFFPYKKKFYRKQIFMRRVRFLSSLLIKWILVTGQFFDQRMCMEGNDKTTCCSKVLSMCPLKPIYSLQLILVFTFLISKGPIVLWIWIMGPLEIWIWIEDIVSLFVGFGLLQIPLILREQFLGESGIHSLTHACCVFYKHKHNLIYVLSRCWFEFTFIALLQSNLG